MYFSINIWINIILKIFSLYLVFMFIRCYSHFREYQLLGVYLWSYIERRFDIMNKRIFVIKILRYITIILLLLTNLVIVIKKWHLSQWLKCPSNLNWVDIQHNETECSLFSICKFSCYIHNNIKLIFLQDLKSLKINDLNYYDTI